MTTITATTTNEPKYHLPEVTGQLRARVLDLCIKRLYHEALDLLQAHGFVHYTRDDLISFYHWAPATLPSQSAVDPDPAPQTPSNYPQPSPDLIADLRKRLADVPPGVLEGIEHTLKHDSIEHAGSLLWKAGVGFSSAETCEYRKTLFPPNAMLDPYTSGPPVLRPDHQSVDSPPTPNPEPDQPQQTADNQSGAPESISSPDPEPSASHTTDQSSNHPTVPDDSANPSPSNDTPPAIPVTLVAPAPRKRNGKSKIAGLPKDIRNELNTRLEENQSYTTIIRWLARVGHPGFNKQNLYKWKEGGYQDWRRENERIETQAVQREWLNEQVAQTKPGELFVLIDQLFVTQLLDSLFGLDTATLKKGLSASPRHYVSLFSAYNRFKRQAMNSEEFRNFLQQQAARKNPAKPPGLTDEGIKWVEEMYNLT